MPDHPGPRTGPTIWQLAHLERMAAHELLRDPVAQRCYQVRLHEDRRRGEIGSPQRHGAGETTLGEPAVDKTRVLAPRRDLEMRQSREVLGRELAAARRMTPP